MVSRGAKRFVCFFALAIGALLIACLTIPSELYSSYVSAILTRGLASQGIVARFEDLRVHRLGLHASRVGLFMPRTLTTIDLVDTNCSPSVLALFNAQGSVSCVGKSYGGDFAATYSMMIFGSSKNVGIEIRDMNLKDQPQFAGFGVTQGLFSLSAPSILIENGIANGSVDISGAGVSKSEDSFFSIPSLSLYLAIPKFSDLNFHAKLNAGQGKLALVLNDCTSSLGKAFGNVEIPYPAKQPTLGGKFNIVLSAEAAKSYGQLLVLATNGLIKPDTTDFRVLLDGNWPKIHARIE